MFAQACYALVFAELDRYRIRENDLQRRFAVLQENAIGAAELHATEYRQLARHHARQATGVATHEIPLVLLQVLGPIQQALLDWAKNLQQNQGVFVRGNTS